VGLIKELVLLPVAPLRGTIWVAEKISEQAEREHLSESAGVEQIDQIGEARERGEINEDRAEEAEEEVLERQLSRVAQPKEDSGGG
jgi:hypothetical protein